jgi:hypothetical protein
MANLELNSESYLINSDELSFKVGVSKHTLLKYVKVGALTPVHFERGGRGFLFQWPDIREQVDVLRAYILRGGTVGGYVALQEKGLDPLTGKRL